MPPADVTLVLREGRDEAEDTKTFLFDAEGLSGARAGQYLLVKLDVPDDPRRGSRSFTMANAPSEDAVMITTRIRSGSAFKRRMAALEPGTRIPAKGPLGKFVLREGDAPALFLAGGIGVTPFRSIIKDAIDRGRSPSIVLLTSDRTPAAIPFRAELDGWAASHPWLRLLRTITRPEVPEAQWSGRRGRIDAAGVQEAAGDLDRSVGYVCGPPAFVGGGTEILKSLGLPPERILVEQFIGY